MNCSSCGSQIPDGTVICPNCGAENQATPVQEPQVNEALYEQPQYEQPMQSVAEAPKKKTGLIIGIILAVVFVAAIVVACILIFVKKDKVNGTYVCRDYSAFGVTVELEIDDDEFTMTMSASNEGQNESETVDGTVEVDGDDIELTYEGTTIKGTIDDDTINLEGMVFEKK